MDNKKRADFYCYIAQTYINRFSELQDKKLLLDSVDFFYDAIKLDSKCIEAYIGLAYLEYIHGNIQESYMLLNKARLIDPVNIKVNRIRQLIKKEISSM